MQLSLKKLIVLLSLICIIAMAVGHYFNSPERRIRVAGIDYNPDLKGGKFLNAPDGSEFDDESLAEIVRIAADFSEPHAIGISGTQVTDEGFKAFQFAPNIWGIFLKNTSVSDSIFTYLNDMPDLVYLKIENCPNLDPTEINKFRLANPKINVESN